MTPKASDLAARLAASATGASSASAGVKRPNEVEHTPDSTSRLVQRFMFILPKSQHLFIRQFALQIDTDVSTIIRALLTRIETDPVFAEEVRNLVKEGN
jgi:hypothetical protein